MISKEDIEKEVVFLQSLGLSRDEIGERIGYGNENGLNAAISRLAKNPSKLYKALALLRETIVLKNVINDNDEVRGSGFKSGVQSGVNSDSRDHELISFLQKVEEKQQALAKEIGVFLKGFSQTISESGIDLPKLTVDVEKLAGIGGEKGKGRKGKGDHNKKP